MDGAESKQVRGTLGAWKMRIVAIMRELADRHEAGTTSASGFAAMAEFLAGRAFVPRPVLIGAGGRRVPGRK
jgi:hypothetical protein